MSNTSQLYLYEEVLLLALQDKKGTVVSGSWYTYAVAGAILAELILGDRIRAEGKKDDLILRSREPFGDELLDECLGHIAARTKAQPARAWISKIASWKELKHRAAEKLCQRGILRSDTDKFLLFFERRVYPEVNPGPEKAIIERLRDVIFGSTGSTDPRTVVLLSLALRTKVLAAVFDRKDLKRRKERIEAVVKGDTVGAAAKEVVEGVQTAIFVSTIAPTMIGPTITS